MHTRVLVVAQQTELRAAVARALVPKGYRVEVASNEKTARQLIRKERFDAAVIAPDSFAPRDLAFLREVQDTVIKLAVLGEDAKACEKLARSLPEAWVIPRLSLEYEKLVTFLKNTTQATETIQAPAGILRFAGCTLDLSGRIFLNAEGNEVGLTRREFALLVTFASNPGRVLSRTQLRGSIDGGSADAYDRSIDMLVARLRRKIEPEAIKARFIVTFPGAGYKFVPRIQRSEPVAGFSSSQIEQRDSKREVQHAERRQLTVLSCRILGFAMLASKLDPEDLEAVISPIYAACTETITRFGGTTLRGMGDSLLAYFGHPRAHENHAESAVRAALELVRAIGRIKAAPIGSFRAKVGIATGLMVVGDFHSAGSREATAVGEALNLALHMQNAAPADGVVITASTRDLVGRFFACRQLAPVMLDEGDTPAPAWHVIGEITGMPRFDALRREGMPELVGREVEIERVSQCWSRAVGGSGQIVMLTGEAGIGKSRLVIELEERLDTSRYATFRYSGAAYHADTPMSVLLDELQRSAHFTQGDTSPQKLEKLRAHFAAIGPAAMETMALVAPLLGLPFEVPAEIGQLAPQKRKERTFASLLARIERAAANGPVFALVEDVHWADPTSLEFIALLVERAGMLPLLLVIVGRPEFVPPWPEHSYITALALSRLSRSDSAALIHHVAGEHRIPTKIEGQILARADGVPLFIEELTKSVLESGAVANGRAPLRPGQTSTTQPIPTTLNGLLLARLDRLDRGKHVAQAGAVIGREFSFDLLRMVAGMDDEPLVAALDQLVSSGLVFCRGVPPHAIFAFKHALIRDAAYEMLLRCQRQKLHAAVAKSYEDQFPEAVEAQPELLAYHFREAGNPSKSVGYLLVAAERALLRSASAEALSHLAQAQELISALPETKERLRLELKRQIILARALLATRSYTAPETREAYRRARELCEALCEQASLPLIIHGQWVGAWIAGEHRLALEAAQQLYSWGERNSDPVGLAVAHSDIGMTLTTLGRLAEAQRHLGQALQINQFVLPGRQPFVASNDDGRISALSFMHNCLLLLGFPDQAEAAAAEVAVSNPRNLYSRALAQTRVLRMRFFAHDAHATFEIGLELLRLSQDQGYPHYVGTAMVYTGWALAQHGDTAAGIGSCERGLALLQDMGAKCWLPLFMALLAECHERAGDHERGAAVIAQALASIEATDERIWEAELYRLKGRLLLYGRGDADAARTCFTTALHKSRAQQAKLLELRATVSLAELVRRENKPTQAWDLLAPVYDSFTEGFDFTDLREAKTLLDSLSAERGIAPPQRAQALGGLAGPAQH